jgi:hypothetical protein
MVWSDQFHTMVPSTSAQANLTNSFGGVNQDAVQAANTTQQVASFANANPGIQQFSDPLTNPVMYGGAGANQDNPYLYNTSIGGKDYLYAPSGLTSGGGGAMANADQMKALGGTATMYAGGNNPSQSGYLFDPSKVTADQIKGAYNYTPGEHPEFATTLATVAGMAAAPIMAIAMPGIGGFSDVAGGVASNASAAGGTVANTAGAVAPGASAAASGATGGLGVSEDLGTAALAPGQTVTSAGTELAPQAGGFGSGGMFQGGMIGGSGGVDTMALPAGADTSGASLANTAGGSGDYMSQLTNPATSGTDMASNNLALSAGGYANPATTGSDISTLMNAGSMTGAPEATGSTLSDIGSFIGSHPDLTKAGIGAIGSLVAPSLVPNSAKPPAPAPGLAATSPVQANLATGAETSLANQANSLYNKPFAPGDFGANEQQAIDAASQQFHALNDPMFNMQSTQLDTQLRNQGLFPGDKAYNDAMMAMQNRQSQLTSASNAQAVTAGQAEQAKLFGQALTQYGLPATTINSLIGTSQMGAPTLYGQQANTSTFNANQYNQKMQQLQGLGTAGILAATK